jgi:membrane associated rhomboid family serine protease
MDVHDPDLAVAPTVLLRFRRALNLSMATVIVLAAVFFLQGRIGDLEPYSIHPQDWNSLPAILTAPLLHGSLEHLAANAFSVLVLGTLAGTVFPRATVRALPLIWLGAGFGTWLIGTGGYHLGISGVTHGLGFLMFTLALLRRDRASIAAALIAFFFFGGMLLTVLPQEWGVSWEYHLSGAVMGVFAGLLWRRADPMPPRRRYSWEDEPEAALEWEEIEPARPDDVPILWHRPERPPGGAVLPFRRRLKDE